ncbi:AMP-binding protein [Baekduia soli]|uniref:AMP-binding protein n=1 Tax=Baekduia soli TaxID=496014 RepID=A0A5B8U0L6_9ACTN|nr:AMP-binding protein [Baekduia soli]QEC46492.1 AMP-binding protein [Baekduia soli]
MRDPSAAPTFGELVTLGARRSPERIAAKERDGRTRSYAELDARTNRLAQALLGAGLVRGDRVAAWMEDRLEYIELYVAAAKAGLVMVPVNARLQPAEAAYHLTDSGARALVWTGGLQEQVERLGDLGSDVLAVATDPGVRAGVQDYEALLACGEDRPPAPPAAGDLYIIGYTSGTTGRPKGAMLTHGGVVALARLNALSYRLPYFSVGALTGSMSFVATVPAHIVTHAYLGGTVVLMGQWDVALLLDTVARERATFTYVPSPLLTEFTQAAARDPRPWSTLRCILHSASRADPDKLRALAAVVGERLVEGWGMTEHSGGLMTATTADDVTGGAQTADVFATVGRAVAECAVEVVGPGGAALPHDGTTVGELVFRSPALMTGYWNRPQETAAALRGGWFHSGDLGAIDPKGYVSIVERRTDLVVTGGMNVYPSEVEACILELDGVAECAVVGLPHERWGQTVAAAVVLDGTRELGAEDVIAHCRELLASFKKPTEVVFVDALPRTASLKIQRSIVRDRLAAR